MYVILIGGGKVGSHLAELLIVQGHRVQIIENHPSHLAQLNQTFPPSVVMAGSGDDPETLERAGIRRADVVVAVTGSDETNLVVANLARFDFNVPQTVARVNNPKNTWLFGNEMGVDVAVDQADIIARLLMEEISLGEMITLLKLRRGQFELVEERVNESALVANRHLDELILPPMCSISAILRQGELIIPKGSTTLLPGDEILALVHSESAPILAALLGPRGNEAKELNGDHRQLPPQPPR
jgi:trk system potassium uptake protein TrkA